MWILFVGDVMLGRLVNEYMQTRPPEYPWGDTLPFFKRADLRICNLECVISDRGVPWSATPKAFHFRTDAKNVKSLKAARIDAVSLANNHTFDFEYDAAFDMLGILDKEGIKHAGAGHDFEEAASPAYIKAGGIDIAFVSFTDNEPGWEALDDKPGVFYLPADINGERAKGLFEIVREAKKKAGLVIVSAHWGPNWGYRPAPGHIPFAHELIDNGADIIFGHSCHVFQGIEVYNGRPVIYSAGNFVDDYAVDEIERNDESFIFLVEVEDSRIKRLRLHPTMIIRFQARVPRTLLAEEIAFKMKRLCSEFDTRAKWLEDEECLEIWIEE